ncbi:lytic polysaccharide monooxygenase [Carnobacterium divergens]|uniref:lytic polysaccharide monooxygenase n=1 Tax=Carnobacterium divergens TaxID=2748 RepID=UPI0039B0D4C0
MKKNLLKFVLTVTLVLGGVAAYTSTASAHGYVSSPASRIFKGTELGGTLNKDIGDAAYEPQSVENYKNTFMTGKLASAGISRFSLLDEQTAERWHKTDIKTGVQPFTWHLTAVHSTKSWDYFMTKQGWDPNQPLDIKNFELVTEQNDNGALPVVDPTQMVTIPSDRTGYHVILAVWNIGDTDKAFYQAIDVNVVK